MAARPRSDIRRNQTGVRLRPEVYKAAQHQALDEGMPVGALFEKAMIEYLERQGVQVPPPEILPPGETEKP